MDGCGHRHNALGIFSISEYLGVAPSEGGQSPRKNCLHVFGAFLSHSTVKFESDWGLAIDRVRNAINDAQFSDNREVSTKSLGTVFLHCKSLHVPK